MNRTRSIFQITVLLMTLMFGVVETLHPLLHRCCGEVAEELCFALPDGAEDGDSYSASSSESAIASAEDYCPVCSGFGFCQIARPVVPAAQTAMLILQIHPVRTHVTPGGIIYPPLAPRPPPVC